MITSKQRAYLRGIASELPCIMQVGKCGIGENLLRTVSDALEAHELVKMSVLDNSDESPRTAADALADALGADVVAVIGKKFVLYRESIKNKRIELP